MNEIVYIDVICERFAKELGGWTLEELRNEIDWIAVTFSNDKATHRVYYAYQFEELVKKLRHARTVIGYNCHYFDFEMIRGHCHFTPRRVFDLFADLYHLTGEELTVNMLLRGTFGFQEASDEFHRLDLWHSDQTALLAKNQASHLANIRRLHNFGRERGYIRFVDQRGKTQTVAVDWKV